MLATGGTIAGRADGSGVSYRAGVAPVAELLRDVPALPGGLTIEAEQLCQADSADIDDAMRMRIVERLGEVTAQPDVIGVVVTHGTDTMAQSAYLAHLTVATGKPVVFVGSMRPPAALGADGPANLQDALTVAGCADAAELGVLVVMNGEVHSARDVTKTSTYRCDSLRSPYGPLGTVRGGEVRLYRRPARRHTSCSAFAPARFDALPRVAVLHATDVVLVEPGDVSVPPDVRGLVVAGLGDGNVPRRYIGRIAQASDKGVVVVRASDVPGPVLRDGQVADVQLGWIAADDQDPARARLLLALGLAAGLSADEIQQSYYVH